MRSRAIRKDPVGQTTKQLRDVFGTLAAPAPPTGGKP